ncbi:hypothetical protein ACF08N_35510 [Streptomyces sp. NPDC015127]|uniref:hypothetical protein n=1 Tax=Streptomyces sp. NPDC015127 TaxID=3364939 RepID=UPI0036F7B556
MLRVDRAAPAVEIIRNLGDRIEEARVNGWLSEVQGLQISHEAARNKLALLDRLARNRTSVTLGMPIIPENHDGDTPRRKQPAGRDR